MTTNEHKNLHFDDELDNHTIPKNYQAKWLWARFEFANDLITVQGVGVERKESK